MAALPGRVVRIRVNPQDCMSVLDIMNLIGVHPKRVSFDQAVRMALSSLIESIKASGVIPTRDGFEYTDMMNEFRAEPRNVKEVLQFSGAIMQPAARSIVQESPDRVRHRNRLKELMFKHRHARESMDDADMAEYLELQGEFINEDITKLLDQ